MCSIKHINIEITKKCNQKCFYCFNDSGYSKTQNELTVEQWKNSLTEISCLNIKSVHITGGEPFLHPQIVEILNHSIDLGLETTILSNGFRIQKLAKDYPHLFNQIKTAQISLDSMTPEINNARRGFPNAFEDAISAINTFINLNVPLEISTTVSKQNLSHLVDIGLFCKTIGASMIIRPLISTGRAKNLQHNEDFYIELEQVICNLKNNYEVKVIGDRFNYVADDFMSERYFVEEGTITVEANGNIRGVNLLKLNVEYLLQYLKVA